MKSLIFIAMIALAGAAPSAFAAPDDDPVGRCLAASASEEIAENDVAACDEAVSAARRFGTERRIDVYAASGAVKFRAGDPVAAAADYGLALKLRKTPELYYARGRCYEILGAYELAKYDFTEAVELNDRWLEARAALGRVSRS